MNEAAKPSERLTETYLTAVLESYRKGQTGRTTAAGHIQTAMQYALNSDERLTHHMQMWLDAARPRTIP